MGKPLLENKSTHICILYTAFAMVTLEGTRKSYRLHYPYRRSQNRAVFSDGNFSFRNIDIPIFQYIILNMAEKYGTQNIDISEYFYSYLIF